MKDTAARKIYVMSEDDIKKLETILVERTKLTYALMLDRHRMTDRAVRLAKRKIALLDKQRQKMLGE